MMKKLLPLLLLIASAASLSAQTIALSVPITPCNNNGVLSASFSGLTPPITVTWTTEGTTGTSIVHTVTGMTDALTSYSGGPVTISATDGTGFAFNSYAGMPPLNYILSTTDAVCPALGTISAVASGGTAPYTYKWFDKSTGSIVSTANPASLPTGNYGVVVTDAAGCVYGSRVHADTASILYTSFSATLTATSANCTNGTASVSGVASTAVLPLSYHWSNGASTPVITGLSMGYYQVEITDAVGCMATSGSPASPYSPYGVYVDQTTVINVPSTPTPATCTSSDGAIAVFPSGGTPPYTYSWSNGSVASSVTGLPSGVYAVTVTDANGCRGGDTVFIGTATPISVTFSSSPSLCTSPTGNASVFPVGGTPPYSYLWYTTPMHTSATATALPAGNYSFKVTDAVGCIRTGTVTVPPVNVITTNILSTSPLCALSNGSLTAVPTGGAVPYTYLWNTGATTSSISSIPAGAYSVRIRDNMSCIVNVPIYLTSYSPVGVGLSTVDASCIFAADGSIAATPFGGTAPYSYGWSTGGTTPSISGLPTGHYWMHVSDASGCNTSHDVHVGYDTTSSSCYCTIEGTVYADANTNCTQDGEPGVAHVQIYCSGIGYTYTDASGHYSFKVPSGSYTITETLLPFYPLSPCQLNNIPVTATAGTGCVHTIDFANAVIPVHNVRISASTIVPPVPGRVSVQQLVVVNEGTLTEDSVYTTYKPDGQLFAPTFTPSGIFSGSGYWYTSTGFPTLVPGADKKFTMNYNVPGNIPLATNVTFRDTTAYNAATSSWLADFTPENNVCNHNTTVVASYDPNFKEVTPKGSGANGIITTSDTVLEYSVHFQNTGTWYAQDVVVIDTLDNDLDWTSLHPVYESAPCQVSLYQSGAVKVAKFTFNNINLPPQASDDLRSTGMFTYTVKTLPGLAIGTQFKNHASIYFDFNAPVMTNTTINTIGSTPPISVNNAPANNKPSFAVYPNPASTLFYAVINNEMAATATMTVADITGKTMLTKTLLLAPGLQTVATGISDLSAGVYFVNVYTNGTIQTQKLVIIK